MPMQTFDYEEESSTSPSAFSYVVETQISLEGCCNRLVSHSLN